MSSATVHLSHPWDSVELGLVQGKWTAPVEEGQPAPVLVLSNIGQLLFSFNILSSLSACTHMQVNEAGPSRVLSSQPWCSQYLGMETAATVMGIIRTTSSLMMQLMLLVFLGRVPDGIVSCPFTWIMNQLVIRNAHLLHFLFSLLLCFHFS